MAAQTEVAAPTSTCTSGGSFGAGRRRPSGQLGHVVAGEVAAELGGHHPGMHRVGVDPERPVAPIELGGEEHVGRLGLSVGVHLRVVTTLVVRVVEVDAGGEVARRAEHHDPRRRARHEQRHQPADQQEVTEVVGPELELEAVVGATEGHHHDAGVGHEQVEAVELPGELVAERPDAVERAELEDAELHRRAGHSAGDRPRRPPRPSRGCGP